ncbi:hypothetical protein H072_1167 [Dactylellina haptotyla CBS 200.50]|uniref:Uncharacterized protein n=1 Tax=Dactylellina haptotyla (strain CBS 200.50) TaxID=1284197 RepID=S8APG3_DACHA|nr:hypothetical protein H072_1167 [Dactylellina haptotyla CBS 200.50]
MDPNTGVQEVGDSSRQLQQQPSVSISLALPPNQASNNTSSLLTVPQDHNASLAPLKTPVKRIFDTYAFTPSKLIPRNQYTDQPSKSLWPPQPPKKCDFVPCFPELNEQYTAGQQDRPSLTKAQTTLGIDIESGFSRSVSQESRLTLATSFLSLKSIASDSTSESMNTEVENIKSNTGHPILKPSVRRQILRAKTLPIENHVTQRVSLVPSGIKLPSNWGKAVPPNPPPKPYQTRFCDGCHRNITLTKAQYICNDTECKKRLCHRCYSMWLDSKYKGHIADSQSLHKAHTAAEFRERCTRRILQDPIIPLEDKGKYIGEASSYEVGHPIKGPEKGTNHSVGRKDDPARTKFLNLKPFADFFGKREVEMGLLAAPATKYSNFTADAGPERFLKLPWAKVEPFDPVWGWDYALKKRGAAAAGRAEPALPQVDYQPPTSRPRPTTSPARTIVSSPSVTIETPRTRSETPTTISSLNL